MSSTPPPEIVDFILRSVDHALRENFGRGLTDENVNVIDPFYRRRHVHHEDDVTGTGSHT